MPGLASTRWAVDFPGVAGASGCGEEVSALSFQCHSRLHTLHLDKCRNRRDFVARAIASIRCYGGLLPETIRALGTLTILRAAKAQGRAYVHIRLLHRHFVLTSFWAHHNDLISSSGPGNNCNWIN